MNIAAAGFQGGRQNNMEIDKKELKKMFPSLVNEMEKTQQRVVISSVRSEVEDAEKTSSKRFASYKPDVVDFIRRCDNKQQTEEIIRYLENRKEIDPERAKRLRKQIKEKGIRSFGSKKEEDYYSKRGLG
ncbi:MAG: DUF2095 domain-containing protein [Candidatus Bathyarchaeota archaeon]|jgi:hypothetical protein|nr:DUF2095 domain-containing protein [Candidatus Bathyarchaeota archaeon]